MDNGASSYRRFLDGEEDGFVEIVRTYKDGLILFLDSFVKNISAAEDLAEETFVKLGTKKPKFSGKSSFKTWLYAIGRNVAVDHIRKQSKIETVSIDDISGISDGELLENNYLRENRKIVVHRAMENLKSEYRQILWLLYFEGFSVKEAAGIMRKNVHGAEVLAHRARQSLKNELIREGYTDENL